MYGLDQLVHTLNLNIPLSDSMAVILVNEYSRQIILQGYW